MLREALNATEPLASSASGQLVDALLDPHQHALVRRRIPLLLARAENRIAALGLTLGLQDPQLDVRFRCADALAQMCTKNTLLKPDDREIERVIYYELARLKESGYRSQQGG